MSTLASARLARENGLSPPHRDVSLHNVGSSPASRHEKLSRRIGAAGRPGAPPADRGEGILGVSLAVQDLLTAHRLVEGNTGLTFPTFRRQGRDRFLIPASLAHGVLIEMVE